VFVDSERVRRRLEIQDEKLSSLQSKQAAESRWSRDEIRDAVDTYLQTIDFEPREGMDSDMMQALLPMMLGGMQNGGGNPPEPDSVEAPNQPDILGQGGRLDANAEHPSD